MAITQKNSLNYSEIKTFLSEALRKQTPVIASVMVDGKWRLLEFKVCNYTDEVINFDSQDLCEHLKIDQPVGICFHLGHFKYLLDSTVLAIKPQGWHWKIAIAFPDKVERVERRAYHRQPVPLNATVKVLFWHRGYPDEPHSTPDESYWQGRLLNLSAGGAQLEIEIEQKDHFSVGQFLGLQFTPMSYQQPLQLESHVKYLKEVSDHSHFRIGVEFLGLEASPEGREILSRILEVISDYEQMSRE